MKFITVKIICLCEASALSISQHFPSLSGSLVSIILLELYYVSTLCW